MSSPVSGQTPDNVRRASNRDVERYAMEQQMDNLIRLVHNLEDRVRALETQNSR